MNILSYHKREETYTEIYTVHKLLIFLLNTLKSRLYALSNKMSLDLFDKFDIYCTSKYQSSKIKSFNI